MLLESTFLEAEAGRYMLKGSLSDATIPSTLQDSLMARLDRLPEVKEVAQLGAVLGREFPYEMLQRLTTDAEPILQAGLHQLVDHDILCQHGRLPQATFSFRHALIRDAAYQSLLRRTRQQLHHRVARLLETQFPDIVETQPELIAYHYAAARQHASAIGYWQRASQRAIERSAHAEAIAHLTQGLTGLPELPQTPEHLRQELDFHILLGQSLTVTQGMGHPEVKQAYDRAKALCHQMGDTPQLFLILRGLILYYLVQGPLQTARQLSELLRRHARAQSDPEPLMLAHYSLGQVAFYLGELRSAQTHHAEALTIYHAQKDRPLAVRYGTDVGVAARGWLARELWCLGYPDQALQHCQAALALAQDVSHPLTSSWVLFWAAVVHQHRREASVVHAHAAAAKHLATEHGFAQWLANAQALHGMALAMQGQSEQGLVELHQGIDTTQNQGGKNVQPYFLGMLAQAYGEIGRPEAGLPPLAEAIELMDTLGLRFYGAELCRLKGVLLSQQAIPDISQAESCFHQALEIARQQQAKSWELRAAMSLCRLWQQQEKG